MSSQKERLILSLLLISIIFSTLSLAITISVPGEDCTRPICYTETYTETLIPNLTTHEVEYPLDVKILCEEGIRVDRYEPLGYQTIYNCLSLNEEGICAGWEKKCLLEYTREVCE